MQVINSKTRKERLLVIGGNAAGMSAASKAKRLNPNLEVIAFEKTDHVSYSACGIPYYISDFVRDASDLIAMTPEEFRQKRGIDVRTRHEVVNINSTKRQIIVVNLDAGSEQTFDYDKLVMAVGGLPHRPDFAGMDSKNVFTIHTLEDGMAIKKFVDEKRPKHVAIVGGGYIAMEMAEAFKNRFLEVTVIEKEAHILPGFEKDMAEKVAVELKKNEVKIYPDSEVAALESDDSSAVQAITFRNRPERLPVDIVLVCTGILPNTRLADLVGLRSGTTGAISVDWKMLTNVSNIYAAGDCTEVKNIVSGKPDYIPLGTTANKQGRVAGENIGGGTAMFKGVVGTSVFKVFNLEVARTGLGLMKARQSGFSAEAVTMTANSKAVYYSSGKPITISIIFEKRSGRLLGAQMVGVEGVSKRIDIFAAALTNKMRLNEMAYLDLSYAPPFAPVWDPVLVAVNVANSKL